MRSFIRNIIIFFVVAALMTGLLVLVVFIPKEMIREKSMESAQYLADGEIFGLVIEDAEGSRIDRYADSILLNIAYCYDVRDPLRSVMLSAYYFTPDHNENENYLMSVRDDPAPNQQYLRYWHGANTIVRPMLTLFSVKQMYILNAVILILMTAAYLILSLKRKMTVPAFGMIAAMILTGCWFVPLSLEYTWTILLMLIFSMIAVCLASKKKSGTYITFFMLSGMITNYFDFLTTETLTLTVPMLLIIWTEKQEETEGPGKRSKKEYLVNSLKNAAAWGSGYAGVWMLKWILAALAFGENTMPYVSEHIGERLGGDLGLNIFQYMIGAEWRNIACLFPLGYGGFGAFAGIMLVIIAAYIGYVYHRKDYDSAFVMICTVIALIPYVRYFVLHNHAYLHCFFTYRAQAATVLAAVFIIAELTGAGKKNK